MNVYDSSLVSALLRREGLIQVNRIEESDVVLVNTCSVRRKAEERALNFINQLFKSGRMVIVLGCMAELWGEKLLNYGASFVVGPRNYLKLPDILSGKEKERVFIKGKDYLDSMSFPFVRIPESKVSAFINIMQGCDRFCSYCVVPRTRGREISRPHMHIYKETQYLEGLGVKEITLLGQNVDAYFDGDMDFAELLKFLDTHTNFYRIRFTTSHPADMSFKVIDVIMGAKRITDWFHLPLQAGSTRVLKMMRRGYTKEEFLELASTIRNHLEDAVITTDIMVAYPGESEKDFEDTLDVVRKVEFDHAYTFIYSPRPGTPASKERDTLSPEEKMRRLRTLIETVNKVAFKRRERMRNRDYEILVEGRSRKDPGYSAGRTRGNIKCVFEGEYEPGTILLGKVVDIKGLTPILKVLKILEPAMTGVS